MRRGGGVDGAGIMFNDITTLLLRPGVFKDAVDLFVERYRGMGIDAVAGNHQRKPRSPDDTSSLLILPVDWSPASPGRRGTSLSRARAAGGC
jgi:hypothetical protein